MKNFLKAVDRKVLNPETRMKGVTWAYMAAAVLLLLHHIYVTVYQKTVLTGARDLYIPFIVFAAASFFMGRMWKDGLFWIFAALLVLKVVRTAMFGDYAVVVSMTYFVLSVYAFFVCYAIARVIPRNLWKTFLAVLCFLWTAAALVYAAFGLKVAFTGVPVSNLGTEEFTVHDADRRLIMIYHVVTSGVILSVSMSMAILGCILAKRKTIRLFYVAAALVLFFTCSLTGTRTAFVMSGANLALLLCIPLYDRLKPGKPRNFALNTGKAMALFLAFITVTCAIAYIQSHAAGLLQYTQVRGGLIIPAARAEEEAVGVISQRGFVISSNPDDILNGRFVHWQNILQIVLEDRETLLLGRSVYNTMTPVNELRLSMDLQPLYHCHNTFLQHLMENGIPGLLLYSGFVLVFLFHAFRVLTNRELPFWQRALPAGAIVCIMEGLIDNTCHVNFGYPQMTFLYLFAGFTIALSRQEKKKKILKPD